METVDTQVFDEEMPFYQSAPTGRRLANFLIDSILFYLFFFGIVLVIAVYVQLRSETSAEELEAYLNSGGGTVVSYLFAFVLMLIFYTCMEGITRGKSLGKLITGTVAIREDGSSLTWKDAAMRSLCRLIPFEAFSGFSGNPWHDSMTKTVVVMK